MGPVREPPPPPVAHHIAPRTSFWVGLRAGWFVPFGSLWARALPPDPDGVVILDPVPWRNYASSGLALEADIGARVARHYTVFALWERAQLGGGNADRDLFGKQTRAESDFWAAAVRASSNANTLGFVTEIAIGYRQARTIFDDGTKLQLTGGAFEGRLGIGAEYRLNKLVTVSPLATIGVGSFSRVRIVTPEGTGYDAAGPRDTSDSHAWFTLTVGGHVDLFGGK
jgi:hypothetical protein